MLQNSSTIDARYEHFISKVVQTQIIYTLEDKQGVAICGSNDFELDGEPVPVLLFWSDKVLANACKVEEWASYDVKEIPLNEFMENWCLGMYDDEVVSGIEFDMNLFGKEESPLRLLHDLLEEVKSTKTAISFNQFKSVTDMESYLSEIGDTLN
ncbi:DUF2750 domain-containing protein [Capnocytophaga canimorsus]|uniref:DUF2750 domain-containing protein n=1 Tax=Capnocytophaga canimorsus TaxID=28188 RepID=UPI0037CD390E